MERDGTSMERAVVITSDRGSAGAVRLEYAWLAERYPGWDRGMQALMEEAGRMYDRLELISPTGEQRTIFFDITDAFGLPTPHPRGPR